MEAEKSFSYFKIFVIGSGFFALMLVWTFYNAYMPLILGEYIESNAIRGFIMGLDNLLAVLLIPIIGTWSDKIDTKIGNRLPFIAIGMPVSALFFIIIPYASTVTFWMLICADVIFLLAMTIYRAPVIALMPDHTPVESRSTANGVINFMGGVGAIIALFGLSALYRIERPYPFIVAGLFLLLTFILLFFTVDRKPPYASSAKDDLDEVQAAKSIREGMRQLIKPESRGQLFIFTAIFLYFIGYTAVEALFTVYAVEHLNMEAGTAGFTLGFFSLAFVIFAIPAGLIGKKRGKAPTMLIGLILLPLIFICIPLLPFLQNVVPGIDQVLLLQIVLFIGGIAWSLVNVQAYPLAADLGGKSKIGYFTGLYYLFSMMAAIIAPGVLGIIMDIFSPPALFFCAALTFFIAYYYLKKGSTIIKNSPSLR